MAIVSAESGRYHVLMIPVLGSTRRTRVDDPSFCAMNSAFEGPTAMDVALPIFADVAAPPST
jgi:hypothetical protein